MRCRHRPNLHQEAQLVPVVPTFDNLAADHALNRSACNSCFLPSRRKSEKFARVGHSCRPASDYSVALLEGLINHYLHIGKRAAKTHCKIPELVKANVGIMLSLAVTDDIWRCHFINRFHPAFIPHFLEPAANQSAIVLRHTVPPRLAGL